MSTRETRTFAALSLLFLVAAAGGCKEEETKVNDTKGLLGTGIFFPYPSVHLMKEDPSTATGWRVDIPADLLPVADQGTPMPVERFNRLDGFSPNTPLAVLFEGVEIDPATLPGQNRIADSTAATSSVQLIDLGTGGRVPLMAELDAHPQAIEQKRRTLIIRPMKAFAWEGRYAAVLTTAIKDTAGNAVPIPANFASLVGGRDIPPSLAPYAAHYADLFSKLEGFGIDMDGVLLAWDFRTGSNEVTLAQMRHIVEETTKDIPADPGFTPAITVAASRTLDADVDEGVDPLIWRHVELTFSMLTFVRPDGTFELDAEGLPKPQGRDEFVLLLHLPPSIHDAPAGSVPVLLFGHGLLGLPHDYVTRGEDPLKMMYGADRYGMILAAAEWRGLSYRDELDAVTAATDFGRFTIVTDDMHMGIAGFLAAARMFRTKFKDEPFFQAPAGGGSLVDPSRIYYMGISLGGHEGGVTVALSDVLDYGVLQVGGTPWSTMLERSSNWSKYDVIITGWVKDPVERQMFYVVTQMLWDPVDPGTYFEELRAKSVLMQESIGDAQVPNISTEYWARSVGIPLVQPSATHPPFVEEATPPLGPGSSALFQYDGMAAGDCGAMPPEANLPAEDNCAHSVVRRFDGQYEQIAAFFEKGKEGTIIHPPACGADPCHPHR